MIVVIYVTLATAGLLFSYRTVRGPSLSSRMVGIDGTIVTAMSVIIVHAMDTGQGAYLPVAVVLALVSFISTAIVARFIEGRHQ